MVAARRPAALVCAGALLLTGCAGAGGSSPTGTVGEDTAQGRSAPASASSCTTGAATSFVWEDLSVDAEVEEVGVDATASPDATGGRPLGDPTDIDVIGWYADGPDPGAGQGSVLLDGHTYTDGSAVFTSAFDDQVSVGSEFTVGTSTGGECTYRVREVHRDVAKDGEYSQLVTDEDLYRTDGPEQAVVITCSGEFDEATGHHQGVSVVIAERL
ncbi:class F sortase [Kytococcus sp. Marseille-QA3725]